ncbi:MULTISPECIES: MalY/PatB family protein [Marinobacter]|uniref:MalY/PatB family protein n=1 Tax=Marinobacter TaxID=2742 RepID=UPI000FCA407C|nr:MULTISPECIES: pyridoxal phosphate-dependent aminotransferase [Marinobacter]MDM8178584.1 pyridoxal phosphate-dependent aminotransferase [Marinobacter salarius]RUT76264.1 pyridoxal phosphate-dependent aminotransferase [Marinobacter sp. NP-6]
MPETFDQPVERENTCSVKFDARKAVFGKDDVIPLWVADMDFPAPEAVTRALEERARHPVYGYTLFPESLYQSVIDWFEHRHGWVIEREWLMMAPGVVPSLHAAALAFAGEGEGVIIQPPVYPPFFSAIRKTGRAVIENPLEQVDGRYQMNLEHLEACAARGDARVLLLCSPHNPVGRVWSESELREVLAIARRHNLVVLSDEIHCDLTYPDKPAHHVLAKLADEEQALITTVAPSKSFNMPGLGLSALVVKNPEHRKLLKDVFDTMHMNQCNPFSIAGFEAGYRQGGPWLDELMIYLQGNRDRVMDYIRQHLPDIRVTEPEGTYLLWLDCRGLGMSDAELKRFFVQEAGIGMNPGITFGEPGSGFMRMNIGCPRRVLETALEQIRQALTE